MLESMDGCKFASPVHLDRNFSVVKSTNASQDLGKILFIVETMHFWWTSAKGYFRTFEVQLNYLNKVTIKLT